MANTPAVLRDLQALKSANDFVSSLLGKFEATVGQTEPISLSTISALDLQALGPFEEWSIPSTCFRGHPTNIMQAILQSQPEAIMQQVTVSDNFLQTVRDSLQKGKDHSLTYNKSEMTRRTAVDTILSAAVSLAETQWDFAVLNAEEYNFSTATNIGMAFKKPLILDKTYLLTGPIDYIVTGLNSKIITAKLTLARQQQPNTQLTATLIQGTNNTVCPIEAKVSITDAATVRQVIGESLVVGKARHSDFATPLPFILSDGVNWKFGIRSKDKIYSTTLVWGTTDDEDILRALVIWTCSQGKNIFDAMVNSRDIAQNLYTYKQYGVI